MQVCIGGASGLLGSALARHLESQGHTVVRLVRREVRTPDESRWDPSAGHVDPDVVAGSDVVVNLSGASITRWPWTESYKRTLLESRLGPTRTLAGAVAAVDGDKPALLSGSGINAYGLDRGDEVLDESSGPGPGYLPEVVEAWEAATRPAEDAGARVCHLRTALVLDGSGGALPLMAMPFRFGLGGRIGSGRQYMPVVSLADWVGSVAFLAENADASGPFNLVAPADATNADLTAVLGTVLHRPTLLPVPALPVRLGLGKELSGLLLGSLRTRPAALLAAGYEFQHDDLDRIVRAALDR